MDKLILEGGRFPNKKSLIKISLNESGYLGLKQKILYFNPEFTFFNENEVLAQIILETTPSSHHITVKPRDPNLRLCAAGVTQYNDGNSLLKYRVKKEYKEIILGDIMFTKSRKFTFSFICIEGKIKFNQVPFLLALRVYREHIF